jgi:hypothetical protein
MTNAKDYTRQSGRASWRLTADAIPGLLTGAVMLIGYVALLATDNLQTAHGAPKPAVAGGAGIHYAMDAAPETRLAEVIVSMGSVELLGADSVQFAHGAPQPAVAAGPAIGQAMDAGGEARGAGEHLLRTYTAWLQTAHVHAAVHGQDAPLPSQF